MAKHPIPFVLALLALPALGPVTAGQKPEPPPGLVRVPGARTKIGTTVKDAEALIVANEGMRNTLAGETPQHSVQVADFFLMVSEVTNEQYLEFVRTMGAKPPENWAA
ncbi:MAG: SUMF1/EgtB/PvdO family nonheme iron enzyme, partial [Planctomycetota bacterium]|nr:SUMF1/EgtB/PvdO family nonheme iron enzyme [Planctomycetota bacterium]